jgi:hypothetical protein
VAERRRVLNSNDFLFLMRLDRHLPQGPMQKVEYLFNFPKAVLERKVAEGKNKMSVLNAMVAPDIFVVHVVHPCFTPYTAARGILKRGNATVARAFVRIVNHTKPTLS